MTHYATGTNPSISIDQILYSLKFSCYKFHDID